MTSLNGLTDQPKQNSDFVLADGSRVSIAMEYYPQQMGWFLNVAWQDFSVTGIRMVTSPGLLRQWKNILPFDLAVYTNGNLDPLNLTDFATRTSIIYVLEAADIAEVDAALYPGS